MKERPILFSAPMVKAILEGRKTQTRRVGTTAEMLALHAKEDELRKAILARMMRRYGQPGDRLWVRESGNISVDKDAWMYADFGGKLAPTAEAGSEAWAREWKSCPSIHMPRWASRLTLEITGVRVERVQDISEKDAQREGIETDRVIKSAVILFNVLWDSINGQRPGCAWADNPWVWVVEFRKVTP